VHFSEYDNALKSQTSMSVAQPHKCSGGSRRVSAVTAARRLHACIVCVCVCVCVLLLLCVGVRRQRVSSCRYTAPFCNKKHLSTHDTLKKIEKLKTQLNDGIEQTLGPKSTVFRSVSLVLHYGAFFEKSVSDTAATLFCFSSKK